MKSDLPEYIMASIPHEAAFMKVCLLFSYPMFVLGREVPLGLGVLSLGPLNLRAS